MARTRLAAVTDTMRGGLEDVSDRAGDVAGIIAERVGEAIDIAGSEGRRVSRQLGKQLTKKLKVADRYSHDNPWALALGALAIGIAIGYLVTRDRTASEEAAEVPDERDTADAEIAL